MIKINLISEGRGGVRGASGVPGAAPAAESAGSLNNQLLAVLAIVGLPAGGGYWFLKNQKLTGLQAEVEVKRAEAAGLQKIIDEVEQFKARKAQLEQRIEIIGNLKKNQKVPVQIMDRISQDLPDLLWLDKLTLSGNNLSVEGRALNPNAVAIFTDNLKQDPLFDEPNVSQLTLQGQTVYMFSMTFTFIPPPVLDEGEDAAGAQSVAAGG